MRRWFLPALMITLLLTGCADAVPERKLEEQWEALAAAQEITVLADVSALLGNERFDCTLFCSTSEDRFTVEVRAPETIAGIRATVDADGTRIEYADVSLGVGGAAETPSPLAALPLLLTALRGGSALRRWTERETKRTLLVREYYVTDDTTLTVWTDGDSLEPVHAEFTCGGAVTIRCEIREFTYR